MFTRRGFSLVSLVSGKTEHPKINRITVVVDADEVNIEQITKQLNKLVPVLKVVRLEEGTMVARALMMVKVAADANNRPQVVDAANIFRPGWWMWHRIRWLLKQPVRRGNCGHCWRCWSRLGSVS